MGKSLRRSIRRWLLLQSARIVAQRLSEDRIPRSGPDAKKVDSFSLEIRTFGSDSNATSLVYDLLFESVSEFGLHGRFWNREESRYNRPGAIVIDRVEFLEFDATHYVERRSFTYRSPLKLLFWETIRAPYFSVFWDLCSQKFFNLRTPRRRDRMEVLSVLVHKRDQCSIEWSTEPPGAINTLNLLAEMHGDRLFEHPKYAQFHNHVEFCVESLLLSGDVEKFNNGQLRATGRAIETLAKYEEDNRRHARQVALNCIVGLFAIATATIEIYRFFAS